MSAVRVAIDVTPLQTGHRFRGVGTYVFNLVSQYIAWDKQNQYYLFAYPSALAFAFQLPSNLQVIRLTKPPLGPLSALITHQFLLPVLLGSLDVDVFHSPFVSLDISVPGIPAWQPVKTIVTLHDLIPLLYPNELLKKSHKQWFYRWQLGVAKRSAHILCDSESSRRDILQMLGCKPEQVTVVHLGCERGGTGISTPKGFPRLASDAPYILHVGGDFVNKNVQTLLQAYNTLRMHDRIQHRLVLVGAYQRTQAELRQCLPSIADDVTSLMDVTAAELLVLYRNASLFVFPSLYEGFGLPVLEAMANGVPVITSNRSSLPEVAGDAAMTVDPLDVGGLATAIITLLTDANMRDQYRAKGLQRASEFSWEKTAKATLQVYCMVAANDWQVKYSGRPEGTDAHCL